MDDTAKRATEISRREFGRIAVIAGAVSALAAPIAAGAEPPALAEIPAAQSAQASGAASPADLRLKPALTPDQRAKLDEALGRLAGQLGQMRKHTLPYSAEPAFVFKAEPPRRAPAVEPKG